jgi:hypothetical protein
MTFFDGFIFGLGLISACALVVIPIFILAQVMDS